MSVMSNNGSGDVYNMYADGVACAVASFAQFYTNIHSIIFVFRVKLEIKKKTPPLLY